MQELLFGFVMVVVVLWILINMTRERLPTPLRKAFAKVAQISLKGGKKLRAAAPNQVIIVGVCAFLISLLLTLFGTFLTPFGKK